MSNDFSFLAPLRGQINLPVPATVTLIRHGQTTSNVIVALDTALPGAPLTELGEQQASGLRRHTGDTLTFSSEALRAKQTAERAAANYQGVKPGLKEIAAGELEMRTDPASVHAFSTGLYDMLTRPATGTIPGGESAQEFLLRYLPAVGGILAEYAVPNNIPVAIVTHGSAMALFAALASNRPLDEVAKIHNCHTIVLQAPAGDVADTFGTWQVLSWGEQQVARG